MTLVQPLLGWFRASLKGRDVSVIGIILPSLAAPDEGLAKQAAEWHDTAGTVILVLVGLHVFAALHHRFWLRDDVLASMLRRWVGPRTSERPISSARPPYRARRSAPVGGF